MKNRTAKDALVCMFNRFYFERTGAWAKGWDQERAEMERAA